MSLNKLQSLLISFIRELHHSQRCPICNHLFAYDTCINCKLRFHYEYSNPHFSYKGFYIVPKANNFHLINNFTLSTLDISNANISTINDLIHLIDKYHVFK